MNRLKHSVFLRAFKNGELTLGQLASKFEMNKHQTLELLGKFKIPFADYELAEGLETLDELFPNTK